MKGSVSDAIRKMKIMNKKELLAEMSVKELQDAIYEKKQQEAIDEFGTKKEAEFKFKELKSLEADGNGSLYYVRVEDGCEGWEALVEIDRAVVDKGYYDAEDLVKNHLINFMLDNGYYENGDIEDIRVEEICRYNKPIFQIHL